VRALRCEAYGGPSDLVVRELPDPEPGDGEVLVAVDAAGVNYPDVLVIANRYQYAVPLPFTPGNEFAGRVIGTGPGVTAFRPGDRVMGKVDQGAFSERICVRPRALTLVPPGLDMVSAAAAGVTFGTAYHALVTIGGLRAGDWVVVLGAAGGVGTATVQIATRLGARVVAAAGTPERVAAALELGAETGIAYDSEDLKVRIKEITEVGADVVIDPVGGPYAEQALRAMRWGGRYVTLGFTAGIPRIPLNLVLLKGAIVRGFDKQVRRHLRDEVVRGDAAVLDLLAQGLRPKVSQVVPLDEAAAVLQQVADRRTTAKVVIDVSGRATAEAATWV